MKKLFYVNVLLLFALLFGFSLQSSAKKIKFGEYVVYNGKVEDNIPKGEGKLTIVSKDNVFKKDALFKGIFDGYKINGKLYLRSEGCYPTFTGSAILDIAGDGSYVKVKVINGKLNARLIEGDSFVEYSIKEEDNLVITCYPKDDGIHIASTTFFGKERLSNTKYTKFKPHMVNIDKLYFLNNDYRKDMELTRINWYSNRKLTFDSKENELKTLEYFESIDIVEDGITVTLNGDETEVLSYSNGDYYKYEKINGTVNIVTFEVHYGNNILSRKTNNGKTTYITEDGKRYVALLSWRNGDLKNISGERVYQSSKISDLGLSFFEGATGDAAFIAMNNDPQGMYDLGMAFLEGKGIPVNEETGGIFIEKAANAGNPEAKAYIAKKKAEAAALAEKAEQEKMEYMAAKGIQDDEYADYLVEQFHLLEQGDMLGTLRVGICYELGCGVEKNITTAFKFYKTVSESDDEELQKMATFLMGLCYWRGEGTAKNQTLAFKCLSADFAWNLHEDRINLPRNVNKLFNEKERMGYHYYYLGKCYDQGIGTTKYIEKAIGYYSLSLQYYQKIADVWYMLGYYTEHGKCHSDYSYRYRMNTAKEYYREAANLGDRRAIQALNRL